MRLKFFFFTILNTILSLPSYPQSALLKSDSFTLPEANSIIVDGKLEDWNNQGLVIPLMANGIGEIFSESFTARVSMAWDKKGIYILAKIKDDSLYQDKTALLWKNDAMEIFISSKKGSDQMVQYLIIPSVTNQTPKTQVNKMDYRTGVSSTDVRDLQTAVKSTKDGYIAEINVPFSVLNLNPKKGDTIAINFYILDSDGKGKFTKYSWHYNEDTYNNHNALYKILLGDKDPQHILLTRSWLEDNTWYNIKLFTEQKPEYEQFKFSNGDKELGTSAFQKTGDLYISFFHFEKSTIKDIDQPLCIYANNQLISTIDWFDIPARYVNISKPNQLEPDIQSFEEQDKIKFPPKGAVLFIGSSSIRMWKTLPEDFPDLQVINRGFGGSKTSDALYFFDRIVTPYQPEVIVYYEGSNDLGSGEEPETVVNNIELFIRKVKTDLPGSKVIVLSNVVSLSDKNLAGRFQKSNELTQEMLKKYDNTIYVDVCSVILDEKGMPRPELFLSDSSHLNANGYKLWKELLKPVIESKFK